MQKGSILYSLYALSPERKCILWFPFDAESIACHRTRFCYIIVSPHALALQGVVYRQCIVIGLYALCFASKVLCIGLYACHNASMHCLPGVSAYCCHEYVLSYQAKRVTERDIVSLAKAIAMHLCACV